MSNTTIEEPTRLLWVDVETTGLDPNVDRILEIGMQATNPDLTPCDEGWHSVIAWRGTPDAFIQSMHGPNGLLAECAADDAPTMFDVFADARAYVRRHLDGFRLLPAGSTVRFDRSMLDAWNPGVLEGCSHRSLDVSALMEATRMWNPLLLPDVPKTTDHRVMHCLADSLAYARAYRRLLCAIR